MTSHPTLSQKGREAALFDVFPPKLHYQPFSPGRKPSTLPFPSNLQRPGLAPYSSSPGALTAQGNGNKMQQLPTGPGTQSWDSRTSASFPGTSMGQPFLSFQQGRPQGQVGDQAVHIQCGSGRIPCSVSLISKLPCCNMTAAEFYSA